MPCTGSECVNLWGFPAKGLDQVVAWLPTKRPIRCHQVTVLPANSLYMVSAIAQPAGLFVCWLLVC